MPSTPERSVTYCPPSGRWAIARMNPLFAPSRLDPAAGRIAHQDLAVGAHDRGGEVLGIRRLGELVEEIARRDRYGDHAVEAAVGPLASLAVLEELDLLQRARAASR